MNRCFPVELTKDEIEKRLVALKEIGLRAPVSENRKSALFVLSLAKEADGAGLQSTVTGLKAITSQFEKSGFTYSITGVGLIGPEMVRALKFDLVTNNIIGSLLAFVVALIVFGNVNLVLIAVLPALAAAAVSLAVFPILNLPINVLNTVIPILVLVLALADSIHLTLHFRDDIPDSAMFERQKQAVIKVGPACALTAITTAIAFAAIGVSENQQLRELAIVGALGVMIAYMVVMVTFVLLTGAIGAKSGQLRKRELFAIPDHWSGWILSNSKMIYGGTVVFVCIAFIGVANITPWFNLDENLPTDSSVRITNQKIARDFGGIYRIWSELDTSGENALDTERGWTRLVKLTGSIERAAPGYTVVSLATISRWRGQPETVLSNEQLEELPPSALTQLRSRDGKVARVITITPEGMFSRESLRIQMAIQTAAAEFGAHRNIGLPIMMQHESISVINQLFVGLAIACLISVVLIAGFYGWPMLSVALLVPNALPLAIAAASLAVVRNGELTPTAMLALTVAFGIAIDDSIHLVNRFISELREGKTIDKALHVSIHKTGKAMLVTTVLICAGMLVTMLSSFETIRLFGGMLILTFITAFLADILLLPCLLRVLAKRK